MEKLEKIIISTGGTGGHVFPAISLYDCLKKNFYIEIFSDKRGLKYFKNKENIKIINTDTIFGKNLFKITLNLFKIIFSIISSYFYLKRNKAKMVFGMGGYSSFPICIASYLLKIPIFIYENNLVLGRTNRILLPLVQRILVSNEDISGIKKKYQHKIFKCGYLLREEIFKLEKKNNDFKKIKELTVLIIGGSQSAKIFGERIPEIIIRCHKQNIKFKVIQQCLENQINNIEKIYKENEIDYNLFSFSENLFKYYLKADIVITRSGASSLAELINLRIPFISIPLPSSADGHQLKNAISFEKKEYCFLLDEKLISSKLFEILDDLNKNRDKLFFLKKNMDKHSDKNSVIKVQKLVDNYLNEKN